MDLDEYLDEKKTKDAVSNRKKAFKRGPFTREERDYLRANYDSMTDTEIARQLGRTTKSVEKRRQRLDLSKAGGRKSDKLRSKNSFVAMLDDDQKNSHFLNQLRSSSLYRALKRAFENTENKHEWIKLYEQKYVDFMLDPTIETVTQPERDLWHEMTIAQIRVLMFIRKEGKKETRYNRDGDEYEVDRDFSKEITQCQEIIRKSMEALKVTRSQRLKNTNDQAINFTEVIKELRSPEIRRKTGDQAAMFNYITSRHYNDQLGKGIISGDMRKFDTDIIFKNGKEPKELDGDFTGEKKALEEESAERNEQKEKEQSEEKPEEGADAKLVATTQEEEQR